MGVNGLWTVVQPCARPTNLATLNRKRLAVDASIWIYQFLKAVRDKEGNALRNSHVVGFFRRICKLLWFGILPVFVFDGGAPALKRATLQGRQRRREGRREDAVRTAGKLLAVQMQRIAEEEDARRKRGVHDAHEHEHEEAPAGEVVYAEEVGMSQRERMQGRGFRKQDAYHLPELDAGIAGMAKPEDPRIMSVQELEDYAKQFHEGEDVNLYDFSKIDFDGDFFKSLPPADRYNILNAARLRSRLRMGLSKEQLDDMFPNRMDFSRFQIERVQERNHLTQRLMYEVGMTGTDLTIGGTARVAGDANREYILVKNEGVEGGWALGVVTKDKDAGQEHKPIDVDAIDVHYQSRADALEDEDDEDDFEDVPIEGLNRLPKSAAQHGVHTSAAAARLRPSFGNVRAEASPPLERNTEGSLFVGGEQTNDGELAETATEDKLAEDEDEDLNKAIAMSLRAQHGAGREKDSEDDQEFEDVLTAKAPDWTQKAAATTTKPITSQSGSMIAHIVNNRSNAAVPKRQEQAAQKPVTQSATLPAQDDDESDSEDDMKAIMAKARRAKRNQPAPVAENKKNPFDGPLPFPKLDLGISLFGKSKKAETSSNGNEHPDGFTVEDDEAGEAGGFQKEEGGKDGPKPLPPWMADETDIREAVQKQREADREINMEDKLEAEEEQRLWQKQRKNATIEIDDESDDGSDVMIVEKPQGPGAEPAVVERQDSLEEVDRKGSSVVADAEIESRGGQREVSAHNGEVIAEKPEETPPPKPSSPRKSPSASPEPDFEDVDIQPQARVNARQDAQASPSPEPEFEDVMPETQPAETDGSEQNPSPAVQVGLSNEAPPLAGVANAAADEDDAFFDDAEGDEFSDPEDEELMASLAEEAEEHARFASELNQKSATQNREDYEKELRQLRNQQKKDRRDADEVSQVMVTECQSLLRLFGIPYITAPMEAEAQCAELVRLGLVDGIVTDDSDTFLFGGTRVYKNMFNSNKFVECYVGGDMEKELSLSREQLISLAQLLGSDYTEGLPGVGPVTAVEILSEFPGRSGLADFKAWWADVQGQKRPMEQDAESAFRRKFRRSQGTKLFLPPTFPNEAVYDAYLHPEVDSESEPFQWGVPDVEGLRRFLMATIGWGKERTDEVLVPVIRDMNRRAVEGTQSNITRFFGGGVGAGAREGFAPREKAQSSKRMAAAVDKLRAAGGPAKRKRRGEAAQGAQDAQGDGGQGEEEDEVAHEAASTATRSRSKRTRAS